MSHVYEGTKQTILSKQTFMGTVQHFILNFGVCSHNCPVCICTAGLCIWLRLFVYMWPKNNLFSALYCPKNPAVCIILLDYGI